MLSEWYTIIEKLGSGGFGVVYKVHERDHEDKVFAVKVLNTDIADEETKNRFNREVRIQSQLKHKNIMPVISFGSNEEGVSPFYAMPLADGNLRDILKQHREDHLENMDDETAMYYFNQILEGVEYSHKEGIIHRDLKPENILVFNEEGKEKIKISDFGLGKFLDSNSHLTQTNVGMGSVAYSAPEQYANFKDVDERADIYSLGKLLYELITYKHPHVIDMESIAKSKLKLVIRKATHENSSKRYPSIREMKDAINLLLGDSKLTKDTLTYFSDLYRDYTEYSNEEALKKMMILLLRNIGDFQLYTDAFMKLDYNDLNALKALEKDQFNEIIDHYLTLMQGRHPFSFTDEIADFTFNKIVPIVADNFDLFEKAIELILCLAYSHHRFYVAQKFANEISKIKDEELNVIIGDVLSRNPKEREWIKEYFSNKDISMYIKEILLE